MGNKDIGNGTPAESYSTFLIGNRERELRIVLLGSHSGKEKPMLETIIMRERERKSVVTCEALT